MPDRSFLAWPFFEERHRALAAEIGHLSGISDSLTDHADVDAKCRSLVRRLADRGILRHTVPAAYGGASERLDVRTLCLVRETLARSAALADFAFAMQGLGSGAISLFGSEEQRRAYLPAVAQGRKIAAFALSEAALPINGPETVAEVAESMMLQYLAKDYPHLSEFSTEHILKPGYDFGHEFEFGLELVLDGLTRSLASTR